MHIDYQLGNRRMAEPAPARAISPGDSTISTRLAVAIGEDSIAGMARKTGYNAETVRRYLNGGRVPASFVAAVSREYGVDAAWLVLGDPDGRAHSSPASRISTEELIQELERRLGTASTKNARLAVGRR